MSFEEILSKKSTEIEAPKPVPNGTYLAVVTGPPKKGEVGVDRTDVFDYDLRLLQPMDDVNPEELAAAGGLKEKPVRARFFLTEDAAIFLKTFCDACGVEEGDKSLGQRASECQGRQLRVLMKQTPSQKGDRMYSNPVEYSKA